MDRLKENLDYMINQIEHDIEYEINSLEEDFYFEMTKDEIINSFHKILLNLKKWKNYFDEKNIANIKLEYKELEQNISQLELCLADYENKFKLNGISYSLFKIGEILIEFKEESD